MIIVFSPLRAGHCLVAPAVSRGAARLSSSSSCVASLPGFRSTNWVGGLGHGGVAGGFSVKLPRHRSQHYRAGTVLFSELVQVPQSPRVTDNLYFEKRKREIL